jgi:hypothetical protein
MISASRFYGEVAGNGGIQHEQSIKRFVHHSSTEFLHNVPLKINKKIPHVKMQYRNAHKKQNY